MSKSIKILNLFLVYFCITFQLSAGNINVVDGDSLVVNGVMTRMYGIDAPEYKQTCLDENEQEYQCGNSSKEALQNMITDDTICSIKGHDKHNRILTVCYNGNIDINKEMVKKGFAVAYSRYSDDYIDQETKAKENKIGLWRGTFIQPEKYRIMNRNRF